MGDDIGIGGDCVLTMLETVVIIVVQLIVVSLCLFLLVQVIRNLWD